MIAVGGSPPGASRFAAAGRGGAWTVLAALPVLMLLTRGGGPVPDHAASFGVMGRDYYADAAAAARVAGATAPSAWGLPPPALPLLLSYLPVPVGPALLVLLAGGTAMVLYAALAPLAAGRTARVFLAVLLVACVLPWLMGGRVEEPAGWAALLSACALAAQARSRWMEAAALGIAAGVAGPTALPFLAAAFILAAAAGSRAALAGWAAAIGLTGLVLAVHLSAVTRIMSPSHPVLAEPTNPLAMLAETVPLLPRSLAGPLTAAALWGLASRPEAAAAALLGALLFAGLGAAIAPEVLAPAAAVPLLAGLAFCPQGLAEAWRAAFRPVRRVTIRRVTR